MSRIIVKNLPKNITEAKLRTLFDEKGTVTDVQLKYTKDGVFRQFAFVGFETEEQGSTAVQHFNKTCIQTNRIQIELCEALGSEKKPKSWSKHSTDSSAFKKIHGTKDVDKNNEKKEEHSKKVKKTRGERIQEMLAEHKDDPKFIEFMKAHDKAKIWENDLGADKYHTEDNNNKSKIDENSEDDESSSETAETSVKVANQEISDADYMKSLLKKSAEIKSTKSTASMQKDSKFIELFTIKIRNLPFKTKRQDVVHFFKPTKPYSIRLPTKVHGICYVGFKTENDFKRAMLKNRSFWKNKQILFTDFTEKNKKSADETEGTQKKNSKWAKQEEALRNEEDISESGRIFFRNLAYTATEEELREMFEKFGPIADLSLPIDAVTRVIKGFGTVTFVMPEHALRAYNELDGSIFHGRLLHLIPGKTKDDENPEEDGLTFKQKKALKLKKTAGSTHNWNTLFLGANAVADLLAKHYDATKEQILDSSAGGSSAAVRLALGETEIILEMKKFLEDNDVCLDVFDRVTKKRSNTVIIAKNLPAETTVKELQPLFSKFGLIGRIVLPSSGVTALIEFLDPSEARAAFKKLAYSKFKNLPLYLEWAPENVFKSPATNKIEPINAKNDAEKEEETKQNIEKTTDKSEPTPKIDDAEDDDSAPEMGTTLFLRNLNFSTREPAIRKHFRKLGSIHMIQVAMKKDPTNPGQRTSLGYGFIQFKKKATLEKALSTMQFTIIERNKVELKRSDRVLQSQVNTAKKSVKASKQTGTKILVRNIPFQAKPQEIREIFQTFGELKTVRLPMKMGLSEETHRGFGFVDYYNEGDAKKAFESLCQSTHLYGRRLVLEWAAIDEGIDELRKRTAEHFHASTKKSKRNAVFDTSNIEPMNAEDEE